jgi:general L-amino acid transport system permease protein
VSDTTHTAAAPAPGFDPRFTSRPSPEVGRLGIVGWLRANLFSSWWSSAVTLVLLYLIVRWVVSFFGWAILDAVWTVPYGPNGPDSGACRQAGAGACWAIVADKYRLVLFGRYPYDQQWRPAIVTLMFICLYGISVWRRFWRWELALIWVGAMLLCFALMWGGVFGLDYVAQEQWGGLPITLMLATFGLALAFPLAIVVALGRRAANMPAVRWLCVVYVELIRGVPLISLLFMASVLFPLFMPVGLNPDKLLRAQVAFILFAGAYLAEVVRGGLQALSKGQYEAADALGLSYWKKMGLIILPQALRMVIPPLVNNFCSFFRDTSLVLIIGIFDLLTSGKVAMTDPRWQGFATEIYLMVAAIYFVFCYAMSKYSRSLESEFGHTRNR